MTATSPRAPYWSVCIDFGTANSKAAIALQGGADVLVQPLVLSFEGNPFLLPGRLAVDSRRNRVLFGLQAAQACSDLGPGRETLHSFKTLLAAPDLARSVRTLAKPAVDPTRRFRQRDLLVAFLAFLLRRVDGALTYDQAFAQARQRYALRYTRPDWRGDAEGRRDREIAGMFKEAARLARALPLQLEAGEVEIDVLLAGLDAAARDPLDLEIEGAVFEAAAAAASYLDAAGKRSSGVLVLDVGAGTTDIGALRFSADRIWEIPEARRTIDQAGDALDRVLLGLLIDRARVKGVAEQGRLWRELLEGVRDGKEQMFASGQGVFSVGGKLVRLKAKEALQAPEARDLVDAIETAYASGLQAAAEAIQREGGAAITVIAAGGGSRLAIIRDLVRTTRPRQTKVKIEAAAAMPDWAAEGAYADAFGPIFPLLSIAIGGAIAPPSLIAPVEPNPA